MSVFFVSTMPEAADVCSLPLDVFLFRCWVKLSKVVCSIHCLLEEFLEQSKSLK